MTLINSFFYIVGICFLALAKVKNIIKGYTSPKPFELSESDRCINYDIQVVDHWLSQLGSYASTDSSLNGKNVLELGPGSDLGIGIYLLSKGCSQYNACDVNNLMASVPVGFYEKFLEKLRVMNRGVTSIELLREQLQATRQGKPSRLNYVVRKDFDIVAAFGKSTIDLVFSQAAFEHFDDIDATVAQLSQVCKPGAILVVEIDLKTHSRWVRDVDPNNIYRYPNWLYSLFWFRGIPNRVRPFQYKAAFESNGWESVSIIPLKQTEGRASNYAGMNIAYADKKNQMEYLSVMLCARKRHVDD